MIDAGCDPAVQAMVERQARAWELGDFDLASRDWLPAGVLTAPGVEVSFAAMRDTMAEFHHTYCDLHVEITNIFASPDQTKVAIEWDWAVSRRSDGQQSVTHDAIIVDLLGGQIVSWREYFDPTGAVEATAPQN